MKRKAGDAMPENVFEKISAAYYELTASEKKTADYILVHRGRCQYLSIAELAEESGVAEATVSRFCRRLGYKGFPAFKLAIANAAYRIHPDAGILSGPVGPEDTMEEMCQKIYSADQDALHQTLALLDAETIRRSVDCLRQARRVLCMGQGGSMLMAREAQHVFSTVTGKFSAVEDSHSQMVAASNMDESDVLLFFSYSGATRDMQDVLRLARQRGAKILLVTRFSRSPGASLADLVLLCGSNEGPLQLGS
ncbi:MAG: MurR/RpiR family transcriptional regulator, partial [Lachnospiraceae bacterium]|nr:MurR/RpiR family transcriptional regulator [Lachnospiraceae bacterium]